MLSPLPMPPWVDVPPESVPLPAGGAWDNSDPVAAPLPGIPARTGLFITQGLGQPSPPSGVAQQGPGSLAPGTYYYALEATGLVGQGSTGSGVSAGITFSAPNNSIQLTWTAVPGATGYVLYRSTSPTFTGNNRLPNMPVTALIHTDLGAALQAGTPPTATKQDPLYFVTENGDHYLVAIQNAHINADPESAPLPAAAAWNNSAPVSIAVAGVAWDNSPPVSNPIPNPEGGPPTFDNNPPIEAPLPGTVAGWDDAEPGSSPLPGGGVSNDAPPETAPLPPGLGAGWDDTAPEMIPLTSPA